MPQALAPLPSLPAGRPADAHRPDRGGALPPRRAARNGRHQGGRQLLAGARHAAGGQGQGLRGCGGSRGGGGRCVQLTAKGKGCEGAGRGGRCAAGGGRVGLCVAHHPVPHHPNHADVVYLDAKTDSYLEEVSSCNIFAVKGKTIRTPPLAGACAPTHGTGLAQRRVGLWLATHWRGCRPWTCGRRARCAAALQPAGPHLPVVSLQLGRPGRRAPAGCTPPAPHASPLPPPPHPGVTPAVTRLHPARRHPLLHHRARALARLRRARGARPGDRGDGGAPPGLWPEDVS